MKKRIYPVPLKSVLGHSILHYLIQTQIECIDKQLHVFFL